MCVCVCVCVCVCGAQLDIWALGVSVFMWVYGRLPFNGAAPFLIYESIKRKEFSIPTDTYSSQEVRDFLQSVLEKVSALAAWDCRPRNTPMRTCYVFEPCCLLAQYVSSMQGPATWMYVTAFKPHMCVRVCPLHRIPPSG